jgi:hypothetical protein
MTPREYTLHRIILLGLHIKARDGRDDCKVQLLRELYLTLKGNSDVNMVDCFDCVRKNFIGLDLICLNQILIDEVGINQLLQST